MSSEQLTTPGLTAVKCAILQMNKELAVIVSPDPISTDQLPELIDGISGPINYFALATIEDTTQEKDVNSCLSNLREKVAIEITWLNVCEPLLYHDEMRIIKKGPIMAGRLALSERVGGFTDIDLTESKDRHTSIERDRLKTVVDIFPSSQSASQGGYRHRHVNISSVLFERKLRRSGKKDST